MFESLWLCAVKPSIDCFLYNPFVQICCGGKIQPKGYPAKQCCGSSLYNPLVQMCCSGRVTDRPSVPPALCCGTTGYNPKSQVSLTERLKEVESHDYQNNNFKHRS